VNNSAQKISSN